jgi:hypothetical protein
MLLATPLFAANFGSHQQAMSKLIDQGRGVGQPSFTLGHGLHNNERAKSRRIGLHKKARRGFRT